MIITIVGGGIAGIYLAHKLLLEHGDEWAGQIVLVEGNRLGGRVQTIKKRGHGTVSQFEAGAARFFSNHHSLVNLMNKLGFTKKKDWIPLKIPTTFRMLDDKGDLVTDKWVKQSMEKAIEILKNNDLTGLSLQDALVSNGMSRDLVSKLFTAVGYPHLLKSNAEGGLWDCRQDYILNQTYYLFKPGLSTLIDMMINQLKKSDRFKSVSGLVKGWTRMSDKKFEIDYFNNNGAGKKLISDKLVLAIPPNNLKTLSYPSSDQKWISETVNSIISIDLLRQFALYPEISSFYPKMVTDNRIQRQFMGGNNHLIQTSYTSDKNAHYWIKMDQNKRSNTLAKLQTKTYNKPIPKPTWEESYYWSGGIHMWKPKLNMREAHKKLLQEKDGIWLCGEAYALRKRWINSSLQSAESICLDVIKDIPISITNSSSNNSRTTNKKKKWDLQKIRKTNKTKSRNIMIIGDNLYDVADWLKSHPGGAKILEKWTGKDATQIFKTLHKHSNWAKEKMDSFKINSAPFLK